MLGDNYIMDDAYYTPDPHVTFLLGKHWKKIKAKGQAVAAEEVARLQVQNYVRQNEPRKLDEHISVPNIPELDFKKGADMPLMLISEGQTEVTND